MAARSNATDRLVGRRIREERTLAGLCQSELAEHIGIRAQQIQKYEAGVNRITVGRLYLIAELLGVPIDDFFRCGGDGKPPNLNFARALRDLPPHLTEPFSDFVAALARHDC